MANDTLKVFGTTYTGVTGIKASDGNNGTKTYVRPQGSQTITQNGTVDVTTLEQVVVSVAGGTPTLQDKTVTPTTSAQTITADAGYDGLGTVTVQRMPLGTAGTPTANKGAVSNHSVTVTPKVTNVAGYVGSATLTGTAVTVTASELVSGNKSITSNGTNIDVSTFSTVSVDVPVSPTTITAGDTPVMMDTSTTRVASTSYVTTNCSITIPKAGTYKFYWVGMRSSTSGTSGTRLYKNDAAQGTAQETWSTNIQECNLSLTCAKNDVITVYARSRGTSYYTYVPMLVACIDWDNGFTS